MSKWAVRDLPHPDVLGPVGLIGLAVAVVVLTLGPWASALGPELRTWCLAYPAYLAVVLDPFTSIFRYALPLFPLLAVVLGGGWAAHEAMNRPQVETTSVELAPPGTAVLPRF